MTQWKLKVKQWKSFLRCNIISVGVFSLNLKIHAVFQIMKFMLVKRNTKRTSFRNKTFFCTSLNCIEIHFMMFYFLQHSCVIFPLINDPGKIPLFISLVQRIIHLKQVKSTITHDAHLVKFNNCMYYNLCISHLLRGIFTTHIVLALYFVHALKTARMIMLTSSFRWYL